MKKIKLYKLFRLIILNCIMLLGGCRDQEINVIAEQSKKHWVEVIQKGTGKLYVDEVPVEKVLRNVDTTNNRFIAYQVGFQDDLKIDDHNFNFAKGKYFQYEMQNDWTLLARSDSIRSFYFQPVVTLDKQISEGVLVFELPKETQPDTLIYQDSFGNWNTQKIIINSY